MDICHILYFLVILSYSKCSLFEIEDLSFSFVYANLIPDEVKLRISWESWSKEVKVLPGELCFKGKIFPNMSQNSFIMHHRHMRIPCSGVNAFSITIKLSVKHQLSIVYTFHQLNISWMSGWPSPVTCQGLSLDC